VNAICGRGELCRKAFFLVGPKVSKFMRSLAVPGRDLAISLPGLSIEKKSSVDGSQNFLAQKALTAGGSGELLRNNSGPDRLEPNGLIVRNVERKTQPPGIGA
jgi:hypothetical protein